MHQEHFGTLQDGSVVERLLISNGALSAQILTYGCVIQDLRLSGHPSPLVLGFNQLDHYLEHSPYFGALCGRCANRIGHGRAEINGQEWLFDKNDGGQHTLHGGRDGISQRNWQIVQHKASSVTLALRDPHGHMGFEGNCDIECRYQIIDNNLLEMTVTATTDQLTVCNLAHHSYFNLDGQPTIADHEVNIHAEQYLPLDQDLIPTGAIASVADTPFDFQDWRRMYTTPSDTTRFDLNYCLPTPHGNAQLAADHYCAAVYSPVSDIGMAITTTEAGIQFYDGYGVNTPVPGLTGQAYGPTAGLCLEPQAWPDAINHPAFESPLLHPGETYRQISRYAFTNGRPNG